MGDFILNLLNSPAFQMLVTTFLASVAVDSTIAGIKQVKDAIKNKPHESQLLDSLEQAFFATERELGWKHDTETISESFFGSLLSFTGSFTKDSLARIFIDAVKTEVTDEQINVWITNILKQLSYPSHTDLREFLILSDILNENSEPSSPAINYILTPNSSVCENKDIIGRDPFINDLLRILENKNSRIQIAGMGGLGKTETLSKLFARLASNREASFFDHIAFIRFSGDILSDIQSQVDYPNPYHGLQGVEAAKRYLQDICQEKKVLLCLDDIRKEQPLLDDHDPNIEFLRSLSASILLAARAGSPGFDAHDLEFLSIDECIQVFERQYGRPITNDNDRKVLEGIIKNRAGNHTLVVNRLGSMAKIYSWSIPVLSKKLEENSFNFAKSMSNNELLQQEINKLYQINDTLSDPERNLLEAFSIFPAAPLSADLCVEWLHEDAGVDEDNCARLLNRLAEQTWLEKQCENKSGDVSFWMHQLVRTAVQEQVKAPYTTHQKLVKNCTDKLVASNEGYELKKSSLFIPFAISIFENLFQENMSFSELACNIADYYDIIANYKSALIWYMKDLDISEKILDKNHPDTASSYNNIAILYSIQGNYDFALEWCQKSLAVKEKIFGKNHPEIAGTYNNIAIVYQNQGKYDLALEWLNKALVIDESILGKNHPDTAKIYYNIASVYYDQGEYNLALEWYMKDLAISEKVLGKDHPDTASTYNSIANVYEKQGKYNLALEWCQKALAIKEGVLGKDHPETAGTYNNIAIVYQNQGKCDLALEWYEKALAIREKALGKDHPDTASTYDNIANVYGYQGKYDFALEWRQKALAIREENVGKDHPHTANTYHNIAVDYQNQGNFDLAMEFLNKALIIFEARLGSDHPYTKEARESIEKVENLLKNSD